MTVRDCSSMTQRTQRRRKQRSVTCHKSQAHTSAAWLRKNVLQFCPLGRFKRPCRIYLWMVRLLTRISSLSNSPRIRSAPQSRLLAAISLIKLIASDESLGFLSCTLHLCFQNTRKSSRCQRRRVSGWTRKSVCFHVRTILARTTRSNLSLFRETGRLTCRRKIISCCRNSAFSANSSALPLVRSANVPRTREAVDGLSHRKIYSCSLCKQRQIRCLIERSTYCTNTTSFL